MDTFVDGGEPVAGVVAMVTVVDSPAAYPIQVDQTIVPKGIAQQIELLILLTGLPGEQLFFKRKFEKRVPDARLDHSRPRFPSRYVSSTKSHVMKWKTPTLLCTALCKGYVERGERSRPCPSIDRSRVLLIRICGVNSISTLGLGLDTCNSFFSIGCIAHNLLTIN